MVPTSSSSICDTHTMKALSVDFSPGDQDVICGRGKWIYSHTGNVLFREIVEHRLEDYQKTTTKGQKSNILDEIVAVVRHASPEGGFLKRVVTSENKSRWFEVGDFTAREKVSQAFRDALHDHYKSSNTAKKERRRLIGYKKPRRGGGGNKFNNNHNQSKAKIVSPSSSSCNNKDWKDIVETTSFQDEQMSFQNFLWEDFMVQNTSCFAGPSMPEPQEQRSSCLFAEEVNTMMMIPQQQEQLFDLSFSYFPFLNTTNALSATEENNSISHSCNNNNHTTLDYDLRELIAELAPRIRAFQDPFEPNPLPCTR